MDFLIHWPPGPVVATVQCQGLLQNDPWEFFAGTMLTVSVTWLCCINKFGLTSHVAMS